MGSEQGFLFFLTGKVKFFFESFLGCKLDLVSDVIEDCKTQAHKY